MAFGCETAGNVSESETNTCDVAQKTNELGEVLELETYGAMQEIQEEYFSSAYVNAALNGQTGTTGSGVVTSHAHIQSNTEYSREQKTTQAPGPVAI